MKTAVRIVVVLAVLAAVGWLIARLANRGIEIVEPVEAPAKPDEIEAPTEELVEAPA